MTTVNATLSVVTSNQYQKDALRTKSNAYFGAHIDRFKVMYCLNMLKGRAEYLDDIKKAVFYGKGLGEHTPVLSSDQNLEISDENFRDLIHGIVGIITEGGELAERLLKIFSKDPYSKMNREMLDENDKVNLFEELGDVLWYVAIAAEAMGVTIDAIMTANIEKLKKRFPEKFTQEKAIERNIENEQKSLEKSLTGWTDTSKVEPSKPTTKRVTK